VRALDDKGRAIRLPEHTGEKARKATRVRNELSANLGREPADEEVGERLGWTAGEVRAAVGLLADVVSLDQSVGTEHGSSKLGEFIEDELTSEAPEVVIPDMENTQLREWMDVMPDRERHVLLRRYGLDQREPANLAELSNELGVTREQVRQLQRRAERRIRGHLAPERHRGRASQQRSGSPPRRQR
jgi:RNA polymerase primary sigma factor